MGSAEDTTRRAHCRDCGDPQVLGHIVQYEVVSVRSTPPKRGSKGRTGDIVTRSADAQRRRTQRAEEAPAGGHRAVSVTVRHLDVGAYSALGEKPALVVMAAVQRRAALRSVCAYRTVSLDTAVVVARMPLIDLPAYKRQAAFESRNAVGEPAELPSLGAEDHLRPPAISPRTQARRIREWVPIDSRREYTRTLIEANTLVRWTNRTHGSMTFHLAQFLTSHGCLNRYLHGIGRASSPGCSHCGFPGAENEEDDDAHHT